MHCLWTILLLMLWLARWKVRLRLQSPGLMETTLRKCLWVRCILVGQYVKYGHSFSDMLKYCHSFSDAPLRHYWRRSSRSTKVAVQHFMATMIANLLIAKKMNWLGRRRKVESTTVQSAAWYVCFLNCFAEVISGSVKIKFLLCSFLCFCCCFAESVQKSFEQQWERCCHRGPVVVTTGHGGQWEHGKKLCKFRIILVKGL